MTDADRITLLGAPIDSVGLSGGTELGPAVLRRLLSREGLEDAGDTVQQIRGRVRDPVNGWLAFDDNLEVTSEVRSRVAELTSAGRVPLVLGGCCAVVPGALAGARDTLGAIGLAYIDGHLDLLTGTTSPTGEGADMPVAAVLGDAPPEMLDRLGRSPVVEPFRIAFAGARDREEFDLLDPPPDSLRLGLNEHRQRLRGESPVAAGNRVVETAAGGDPDGRFWLHLDVDVLDREEFPATDYLMDDGLDLATLRELLRPIGTSAGLCGVSVACFNPEKDPDGRCGQALTDLLLETIII